MRNVFHQYSQPENRLSHALACALAEDRKLLLEFLAWTGGPVPDRAERLHVVEQQIPGSIEDGTDEARGLPDISIFGDDGFCLLVESKVAALVSRDQLRRHLRTAERCGFQAAHALLLTTERAHESLPASASARAWPQLYTLVTRHRGRSEWAARFAEFMEVVEIEFAQSGYLREGTLTQFSGIQFGPETPYRYDQAKRQLRLMMDDLRQHETLARLGIAKELKGRTAITGSKTDHVWDYLQLAAAGTGQFTTQPHLTLSLHADHLGVMVTLPNGAHRRYRSHLLGLGPDGLRDLAIEVANGIERALGRTDRARPILYLLQRHYPSQRSVPIEDARLYFDLRTAQRTRRGKVHPQAEWIQMVHHVLSAKGSNIQVGVGAEIPYGSSRVGSRAVLDDVANTWLALEPWLEKGLGLPTATSGSGQRRVRRSI